MRLRAGDVMRGLAGIALLAGLSLVAWRATGSVARDGVALHAEVTCDALSGPGKVQCVVRERPLAGKLRWGDVIVLSAPAFAPPLRTRAAAGDATRSDAEGADFSLALAATGEGRGTLKVLGRAVVCGEGGCRPCQAEATAQVVVGTRGDAGP
jgi:hypothetical protein